MKATAARMGTKAAERTGTATARGPAPRIGSVLVANTVYAFCLNVPEVALPLVLVTQVHASPAWAAMVFVINTMMVVALQVGVTVWMSRFSRRAALTAAGAVLALAYVGFLLATPLRAGIAAPAIVAVSVVCTFGEIMYAGSITAYVAAASPPNVLGKALGRLQLSTGFGLAISPAVMTALAARGTATLWLTLAVVTLLAAALIHRSGNGKRIRTPGCDDVADVIQEAETAPPAPAQAVTRRVS